MKINPEFENLIPPLSIEEYEELKESIVTYGCRDPLVIWNETIIDGHNRFKICQANSIAYKTVDMTFDFETKDEVKAWIIKNQFARRNIDKYQRSQLALKLKDIIAGKAKENQLSGLKQYNISGENTIEQNYIQQKNTTLKDLSGHENTVQPKSAERYKENETREQLAKIAGVSHDTIHKVETIETEAPESVREAARNNVVSINKAYEITKSVQNLPKEEQEPEAIRMMNARTAAKNKEIDRRYNLAKSFAKVIEGIGTYEATEEALNCYLEYSPQEVIDDFVKFCDQGIVTLQQVKAMYTSKKALKVVK